MLFAFDILDMSTDSQCGIGSSPSPLFIITSPKTHLRSRLSDDTVDTGDRPARRLFGASSKKGSSHTTEVTSWRVCRSCMRMLTRLPTNLAVNYPGREPYSELCDRRDTGFAEKPDLPRSFFSFSTSGE
jgi:hypothetical protein